MMSLCSTSFYLEIKNYVTEMSDRKTKVSQLMYSMLQNCFTYFYDFYGLLFGSGSVLTYSQIMNAPAYKTGITDSLMDGSLSLCPQRSKAGCLQLKHFLQLFIKALSPDFMAYNIQRLSSALHPESS